MFIFSQLIHSLAMVLDLAFKIYYFLLLARIFLSWVNPSSYNPIVQFIYGVTEPFLGIIRRFIPLRIGVFDLSPIFAFLIIAFLQNFLVGVLLKMSMMIK
ncbi:MAG: YggT family protein [bacterium]|nr:YggT family protein [bacterium]